MKSRISLGLNKKPLFEITKDWEDKVLTDKGDKRVEDLTETDNIFVDGEEYEIVGMVSKERF